MYQESIKKGLKKNGMKCFKSLLLLILLVFFSCKEEKKEHITIYTIGDSTMANKPNPEENPERGWAQLLPQFLSENVTVENHAVNGRSTRSFIAEKNGKQFIIN